MKRLLLCLLMLPLIIKASVTDSLLQLLPTASDTVKVNVLNGLAYQLCENDPEKSLAYGKEAAQLSDVLKFKKGKAMALNAIGIVYDVTGNYDSAIYYYDHSLEISTAIGNKKQIANTLNNIGLVLWNKGEYENALKYYHRSLQTFQSINNRKGEANTLSNIGLIYTDLKKHNEALTYHLQALKIREEIADNYGIGVSLTNIGITYSELNEPEKSISYLKRSIEVKQQNEDLYGLAISLNDLGILYYETNNYPEALKYHLLALPIREQLNDKFGLITTYNNLAGTYSKLEGYPKALEYSLKSLPLAIELNSRAKLKTVYRDLSFTYKKLNNYPEALSYYEKYSQLNDSIFSEEGAKQIAELETKYETGKKDLELKTSKLLIAKQETERNILLLIIIAIVLISLLLYNRYKLKQKNLLQQERNEQQLVRTKAIVEAEENERARIARELHDGIGQQLSAVKLNLSSLQSTLDTSNHDQSNLMKNAIEIIDDSVKEVRTVSHSMMPNALLKSGLASAVREFLNKINNTGKIRIEVEISGLNERLEHMTENILFRVVQESVNNIIKHSQASKVNIQIIRYEKELNIIIEDNGIGFDPAITSNGIGLKNIESRINFIHGTFNIDSSPGKGTTITIEVPLNIN